MEIGLNPILLDGPAFTSIIANRFVPYTAGGSARTPRWGAEREIRTRPARGSELVGGHTWHLARGLRLRRPGGRPSHCLQRRSQPAAERSTCENGVPRARYEILRNDSSALPAGNADSRRLAHSHYKMNPLEDT